MGDWLLATWSVDRWYFLSEGRRPVEERREAVSRERRTRAEQATGQGPTCMEMAVYQESLGGSGDSGLLREKTQEHQCLLNF